jgi:hypothetical protein
MMMKRLPLVLVLALSSCLTQPADDPLGEPDAGSGGSGGSTGNGSGGSNGSGGNPGSGGQVGSGGTSASGGSGSGGMTASGGTSSGGSSSGGSVGSGGSSSGGTQGSGGTVGSGGKVGSGGTVGTGGTSSSGGSGSGGRGGAMGGRGGSTAGSGGSTAGSGGTTGAGGSPTCSSNKMWTSGNGNDMRPGEDCMTCHKSTRPNFTISGTVYPTAHEKNDCDGTAANGIKIVITGADGQVTTLTPSSLSGSFNSTTTIKMPYTAKVTNSAGAMRAMTASQSMGNCNGCHTQAGANGAPGRIMAP